MKLLTSNTDYVETIKLAYDLTGEYDKPVIFHCYWNGALTEKHIYSVLSCYYFNVLKNKHKIIVWLENNTPNQYNIEIAKYAEIRYFSLDNERNNTGFLKEGFYTPYRIDDAQYASHFISFYSDVVRYLLLYNYGGVWVDLDCFILRSFDPLFCNYENEICVYQWSAQPYPNGAIYISLQPRSEKMKHNIEIIMNLKRGWGFHQAQLTYDLPLDMLVLPCSWFDADWIPNPYNSKFEKLFEKSDTQYDFNKFFSGSFCYHWHNQWNTKIDENSIIAQLFRIIQSNL